MEREKITKALKIFGGFGMLAVSIVDIIAVIILAAIPISTGASQVFYITLMFDERIFLSIIVWISLIFSIAIYLITGLLLIKFSEANDINEYTYSKHTFLIGVILLIISLLQSEFLYLIYTQTPIGSYPIPFLILLLILSLNCYIVTLSLVIGGVGLQWLLENEQNLE